MIIYFIFSKFQTAPLLTLGIDVPVCVSRGCTTPVPFKIKMCKLSQHRCACNFSAAAIHSTMSQPAHRVHSSPPRSAAKPASRAGGGSAHGRSTVTFVDAKAELKADVKDGDALSKSSAAPLSSPSIADASTSIQRLDPSTNDNACEFCAIAPLPIF